MACCSAMGGGGGGGFGCCSVAATPPSSSTSACCGKSLYCTIMSDTLGVLWRGASGTVDPWTKSNQQKCETMTLTKAGMCASAAAQQAQSDVTKTLKASNACPCCFWCGVFSSWKKFFCMSENLGMIVVVLAFVAGLVYLIYVSRHK